MIADSPALGANSTNDDGERGRGKLLTPLTLPKNRSTGNLALSADPDRSRFRMSFEGSSSAAADHDLMTRSVILPFFSLPLLSHLVLACFPSFIPTLFACLLLNKTYPLRPARRSDVPPTHASG